MRFKMSLALAGSDYTFVRKKKPCKAEETYLMMQNRLMLALYTVKSMNTTLVPRSNHRFC